jgi:uncharacterized membrane protein
MSQNTTLPGTSPEAPRPANAGLRTQAGGSGRQILFNWIVMILGLGAIIGLAHLLSDHL